MTKEEFIEWRIENVSLAIVDAFNLRWEAIRPKREQYRLSTVEHVLKLTEEDALQSEHYSVKLRREYERRN